MRFQTYLQDGLPLRIFHLAQSLASLRVVAWPSCRSAHASLLLQTGKDAAGEITLARHVHDVFGMDSETVASSAGAPTLIS